LKKLLKGNILLKKLFPDFYPHYVYESVR